MDQNTPSSSNSSDNKLNGLFDIAEIAESLSAARESTEPSLKKQRQDYSLAPQNSSENTTALAGNIGLQALDPVGEAQPTSPIGRVTHSEHIPTSDHKQHQLPFRKRHLQPSNPSSDTLGDGPGSPVQDTHISTSGESITRSVILANPPTAPVTSPKPPSKLMDLYLPPRRSKKPSPLSTSHTTAPSNSKPKPKVVVKRKKNKGTEGDSTDVYCLCQQPYDPTVDAFMICCDTCDEWYHGSCVGITQKESKRIIKYVCPKCIPAEDGDESSKDNNDASFTAINRPKQDPSYKSTQLSKDNFSGDRKCAHLPCNNIAKQGSKYCSEPCSMSVAREAIKKKQETETTNSAADAADIGALDDIARKKTEIETKLHLLEKEQLELEKAIHSIAKRNSVQPLNGSIPSPGGIDSPSWYPSSPASPSSPQLSNSESSEERQKDTNDKVKGLISKRKRGRLIGDEVCGCPTSESPDGYCNLLRTKCLKHVNWEEMKRATLEQEKTQHKRALSTLAADEMRVRNRIARRKESANDSHRTIVEA